MVLRLEKYKTLEENVSNELVVKTKWENVMVKKWQAISMLLLTQQNQHIVYSEQIVGWTFCGWVGA